VLRSALLVLLAFSLAGSAEGQTAPSKTYRGSIGDKHIEMRLNIDGSKVTGTYFYDQFKQDIKLEGAYDAKGQLILTEGVGKRKTGKFVCKAKPETPDTDLECEWSRPDGTGQAMVFLNEQTIRLKNEIKILPKVITDRKTKAVASYPQFTGTVTTPEMAEFNRLIESLVQAAVKEFQPDTIPNSSFNTNYSVMFADESIVSVEMTEDSYAGGAHPNNRFWTVNYNLKTNKQLTLDDVFKKDVDYKTAIAEFVVKDINKRFEEIELEEAKLTKRQPEKRDEPFMTTDSLPEMDSWGLSAKGFVVYFDFAHVMAVFDRTVVPYGVLARHLRPDGVATQVK
jgi:peptidoglycan-N-acetylmuramic acid deacetylase PdaC-like protein/uncharacterized protein DUF3298